FYLLLFRCLSVCRLTFKTIMKPSLFYITLFWIGFLTSSCEDFLDVKSNKSLAVASDKLANLQLLLDNVSDINSGYPSIGILASDDVYMLSENWEALSQFQPTSSNAYIWNPDVFNDADANGWTIPYHIVFQANVVLEGTEKLTPSAHESASWRNIRGSALFYRAYAFATLLEQFSKPYNTNDAPKNPGIVLRLNPDIDEKSTRATQQESYEQVFRDLKTAASLLPRTPKYKARPSQPAAYGLLSRIYLSIEDYDQASVYADSCLSIYDKLIDYNLLDTGSQRPLQRYNDEVIFHNTLFSYAGFVYPYGRIDTTLYESYRDNDLRRAVFFTKHGEGDLAYKAGYDGGSSPIFGGIATDEILLIKAECLARAGELKALDGLNRLLQNRYSMDSFVPITSENPEDALALILEERRKELVFRGLRWSDLRRLNGDSRFKKTIVRRINNSLYELNPDDKRYTFPIPKKVVEA